MNATQQGLVDQWFTQLGQGLIDDSMTRRIAQLVELWGGFGRLAHWITMPAAVGAIAKPSPGVEELVHTVHGWVNNQLGGLSLALGAILGNSGPNQAWNVKASQSENAALLVGLNTPVDQAGIEQQVELAIIKIDDQTCRVEIGIYPEDAALALDDREVTLTIGSNERKAMTNVYGRAMFEAVPLNALDQVILSISTPSTGVAD
jgi:hypothetical protein